MSEISFPASFEELVNNNGFNISSSEMIIGMDTEEVTQYIQDLIGSGSDFSKEDASEKAIAFIYSAIDTFSGFSVDNQSMFVQYLIDLCKAAVDQLDSASTQSEKNAYKKVLYLFQHFCIKMEVVSKNNKGTDSAPAAAKGKGSKKKTDSDTFSWPEIRVYALEVLEQMVAPNLSASWPMGLVQENFLSGVWNYTLKLLVDRPAGLSGTSHKDTAARAQCGRIFAKTVGHFGSAKSSSSYAMVSTALLEALVQHEHFALAQGAELCAQCRSHAASQGGLVVSEILSEICRMNYANMPATSIKNISSFLEAFAKAAPDCVADAFPVLVKQLDSPAHQIRSAIIQACGFIVSYIHDTVTAQQQKSATSTSTSTTTAVQVEADADSENVRNTSGMVRSRDVILDILIERAHDINPYTRTTVLKVWSRLLETGSLPVKRVGSVAQIAVDRLQDKNASVRRNAVVLMTTAIENNPFSGTLDAALFRLQQGELLKTLAGRLEELRAAYKEANGSAGSAAGGAWGEGKGAGKGKGGRAKSADLKAITEEDEEGDEEEGEEGGSDKDADAEGAELAVAAAEEEFLQTPEVLEDALLAETRAKLEYVLSVLGMIQSIETAVPKIAGMLQSKTTGDVVEALRFFTRAINFKVAGALSLFKSAFSLVWHQDPAIKTEMLSAFSAVYLTDGAGEHAEALAPAEVAHNLIHLVRNCDSSEMTSMEKIVGEMFSTRQVDGEVIDAVWEKIERLSSGYKRTTAEDGTAAAMPVNVGFTELGACLRIVSMVSHSVPALMTEEKITAVVNAGLSEAVLQRGDFSALTSAALCLQAKAPFLKHCESSTARDAYVGSRVQCALEEASPMLATLLVGAFCGDSEVATREWFSLCEEAMHALFHLHPCPDAVLGQVLQQMFSSLSAAATAEGSGGQGSVCGIARLLFVLGQTSLCALVYTEFVAATAKKHPVKDAETETKKTAAVKAGKKGAEPSASAFKEETGAVDAMEEEMGAAAAADADHERVLNQIIEQELVMRNLLGKFLPLLSYMVADEQGHFAHPLLRETAVLALCRYMCTSSAVCESLLPLLFTVLEREGALGVRTTVMIALGDLAFRFPNSIEPWTHRMYSRLRDANVTVRYNTLMVITHLVLNDMIKVKGQVSHVAHSLNDPDEAIAELAKLFFIKLSERSNNPVYNLLGDIIGIFSQDVGSIDKDSGAGSGGGGGAGSAVQDMPVLSREQFQSTMHFLLSFVQKDKQADTLLERLLLRMSVSPSVLQRRNLAFCVSELSVTEKGVKKMIELIKNIKDALYDNEVYECFRTTLARAKKAVRTVGATSETKGAVDEFEALMERIHAQANGEEVQDGGAALDMGDVRVALEALDAEDALEGDDAEEGAGAAGKKTTAAAKGKAGRAKAPAKKPAAKSKAAPKKRAGKRGDSSDDDDEGAGAGAGNSSEEASGQDSEQEGGRALGRGKAAVKGKAAKPAAAAGGRSRRAVVRDDDEEDD